MAALFIRTALPIDEAPIAALHTASWREGHRGVMSDAFLDGDLAGERQAHWRAVFAGAEPGRLILVAREGAELAGFLLSRPDLGNPARDLIANLHVSASARGQGIGTALIGAAAERLAAMGREAVSLTVLAHNGAARRLYSRLGGDEGAPFADRIAGQGPFQAVPIRWASWRQLALAARQARLARLAPPAMATAETVPTVTGPASGANHPTASGRHARIRVKHRLGDHFGLSDYGVNLLELAPGAWSSIPHWHSREDEFLYLLSGEVWLVSDGVARCLAPGDCAGFPAGLARAHHLENRSAQPARLIEIGSRRPDLDETDYPGEDLRAAMRPDGLRGYLRRDGRPVD